MEGQMSLFDIVEDLPIIYHAGDVLYQQLKGEVLKCHVEEQPSWQTSTGRFYRIQYEEGGYGIVGNDSTDFYRNREDAEKAAEKWCEGKDMIVITDLNDAEVYTDGRNYAFIKPLNLQGEEMLFVKGVMTFHHIDKNTKKNRKAFYDDVKAYGFTLTKDVPENLLGSGKLYRCKNSGKDRWLYAEYGYGNAVG